MALEAVAATRSRSSTLVDVGWRVLVVAAVNLVFSRLLGLMEGSRPSLSPVYVQAVLLDMLTGGIYALTLLPLARRLPYPMRIRVVALFAPLYWIATLSNLVEAWVDTTLPRTELIAGAVIFIIPSLADCWLIARLFPANQHEPIAPTIGESLRRRPLLSWVWRTLLAGVLFAAVLEVMGKLWSPLIGRYYSDPAFVAQAHTATPPDYIAGPEEVMRGIIFVLVLLPVLAVMRGREWPRILYTALYVAVIDAGLEAWQSIANTAWPIQFRVGEALDLTSDAIVRGIFVAGLLVLPAVAERARRVGAAARSTA